MRTPIHALLALCVVAGLSACGSEDDSAFAASAPPPPTVSAMRLGTETVTLAPEFPGRTAGSREVQVRARIEGILLSRHYDEGAPVKAGDLLFRIDPAPYEVDLARAEARLQQSEARLEAARRDRDRAEPLIEREVISIQDWDDLRSALQLAEADRAAALAEVEAARINLEYTTVRAPIDGVTSREAVSEGSLVGPQSQSLLTTVVRTDPLYVWFSYPESQLQTLSALAPSGGGALGAELILPGGEAYGHKGEVNFTDSIVDPATGTVQARAVFPNPDRGVLPGQFVRVRLLGLALENSLLIPQEAVMQSPQGTFVYRLDEQQRAQYTPVQLGQAVGSRWEVREGLSAGDRIVTAGLLKVQPGAPVEVDGGAAAQPAAGAGSTQP